MDKSRSALNKERRQYCLLSLFVWNMITPFVVWRQSLWPVRDIAVSIRRFRLVSFRPDSWAYPNAFALRMRSVP